MFGCSVVTVAGAPPALKRTSGLPTAVWIPAKGLENGTVGAVPKLTVVAPAPVCVTVIALLSVLPLAIVAVVAERVPPETDKVTLMSNGAPSSTLTFTVAGLAAVRSVLSVRPSFNVRGKRCTRVIPQPHIFQAIQTGEHTIRLAMTIG